MRENVLTSKDVHVAVKRSDGISYLMERFGLETEEAVFQAIRKASPSGADGFIKTLKKKHKKAGRMGSTNAETKVEVGNSAEEAEVLGMQVPISETVVTEAKETAACSAMLKLENLQNDEQDLSNMLRALEVEHKAEVAKRRDIVSQLGKAKEMLTRLQNIAAKQEQRIIELYSSYEQCKARMEMLNGEIRGCGDYLARVREEIAALKQLTIYVYESGRIELENGEVKPISEEQLDAEFKKLVCLPQAEELTIKQLKGIAKLRVMLLGYNESESVELIFDSSSVQAFYEEVYVA